MTWLIGGNSNVTTTSFLGTINPQPLVIKTNNKEAMRVASADGDVSIGDQGATRSPDYKLDVQGILNADDIYKGGARLVGSQWEDVTDDGISYGAGNVGIGELGAARDPDYKLDVQGILNADDIYKDGTQLVGSQWEDVSDDGISYGAGNVGIGKAPAANYKLDVAGTLNATDLHKNGSALISSQWQNVSNGISYAAGRVGIGKAPAANYKLDVAGTLNATDLHKNGSALISSQWQNVSNGISYAAGRVGIGMTSTGAGLTVARTSVSSDEWAIGIDARAFGDGTGPKYGIWAIASGGGEKRAGYFQATTSAGRDWTLGQQTLAASSGSSTGSTAAIFGEASGDGTGPKYGIWAVASGGGEKRAGYFQATSPAGVNTYTSGGVFSATGEGTGLKDGIWSMASGGGFKRGGYFQATSPAGVNEATYGGVLSGSGDGTGPKYGISAIASGGGEKRAGYFQATSPAGVNMYTSGGVFSATADGTGWKIGMYATASGAGNVYAGYFANNVRVQGNFEVAGQKAFLIDHPLDPENKTLRHNSVESPENLCLYRGKVKLGPNGSDTVRMPNYFAALIKEEEATAYLTPVGEQPFPTSYKWNEAHTELTIFGREGAEVAYLVLADRDDRTIHLFSRPVEEEKGGGNFERGKLLSPEAFDQPLEKGVAPLPRQEEQTMRAEPIPPRAVLPERIAQEMDAEDKGEGSN